MWFVANNFYTAVHVFFRLVISNNNSRVALDLDISE